MERARQAPTTPRRPLMTRLKIIVVSLAGIVALVGGTLAAYAGWCWSDPIIGINAPGMQEADVQIDVAVPDENRKDVSSVLIVVSHPANVKPRIKLMDGILPEEVTFVPAFRSWELGQKVKIGVSVTVLSGSRSEFEVQYTVTRTEEDGSQKVDTKNGKAHETIAMEFGLYVHP